MRAAMRILTAPDPAARRRALVWLVVSSLAASAVLGTGCLGGPDDPPLVMAHRATPSKWPENSRSAVLGSLEAGYPGIEIDIVLTRDHVPVIAHDPWLDPKYCTRADGSPFETRKLISEIDLEVLQNEFLCGGLADPAFPDAVVFPDTTMTVDELIEAVRPYPDAWVQLDVKYEPGLTPSPEVFAEAILGRWTTAGLENPWYVSANLPELLLAFDTWMDGEPITNVLIYPRFPPDSDSTAVALENEVLGALGVRDALGVARQARADGIAWPWQLIDWHAASEARQAGLQVMVWTVNDPDLLEKFCGWPIDVLITDYPERAPCLPR
jgi:glycerophosphoryl diester phosphodiesterase